MSSTVRIVKVGGSLLTWPQLTAVLAPWVARQKGTNILIAGGGFLADSIRRFDRRLQFGVEEAHWLCVSAMSHTAQRAPRTVHTKAPRKLDGTMQAV